MVGLVASGSAIAGLGSVTTGGWKPRLAAQVGPDPKPDMSDMSAVAMDCGVMVTAV